MRVVLTGASGLLGRHVYRLLRSAGYQVIPVSLRRPMHPGTILADLTDSRQLTRLPSDADAVIHLAALLPARGTMPSAQDWIEHNTGATLNLLEYCAKSGIRNFVLGSSWSVYGKRDYESPIDEETTPSPEDLYGISKHAAELLCSPYDFYYGIRSRVLRFSYIYGEGMRDDTVVLLFLKAAALGTELTVYNEGGDVTDLVHVSDAAEAVLAALERGDRVYNIGGGAPTSIRALAERTITALQSRSKIVSKRVNVLRQNMHLSIEKAERELGWRPRHSLLEGLRSLCETCL